MILSRKDARAFYDRLGARQDWNRVYEDSATRALVAHADFGNARAVVEFGCGTGRFAQNLMESQLPPESTYLAVDQASVMVELARRRLVRFGKRARVHQTDGPPKVDSLAHRFDRFVSTYVLDLLSESDIRTLVAEAHRLLEPGGLLCLVSLGCGSTPASRFVARAWTRVFSHRPVLTGGCRPIALRSFLHTDTWELFYAKTVSPLCVPSEVVVAAALRTSREPPALVS